MTQGNIDIAHLNNWHLDLNYQAHQSPLSGFNFVDREDINRYKQEQIIAHIHKGIEFEQFFVDYFSHLHSHVFAVSKMLPGMILPYHTDEYAYFRNINNVTHNQIIRIIVFLEDWKSGHISEVNGRSITNWKQGDWIQWIGTTPHMAANLGLTDRYTLQITGVMNDSGMR
jgi:hypothetical protein